MKIQTAPRESAITCEPPVISNGYVSVTKPVVYGSTVTYHCNQGFVLDGEGSSRCAQNGTDSVYGKWTDQLPVCKAITCEPPVISNGHVSVTKTTVYGSTVTYHCNPGFVLDGKESSKCTQNGTDNVYGKWTDQLPVCKAITCEPPVISNGHASVTKPAVYGSTVTYHCNQGFVLDGKGNSKCIQNGTDSVYGKWNDQSPVCKAITCEPPVISNGHVSVTKPAVYGSTVTYHCNQGFVLDGKGSSLCSQNGTDNVYGKWTDQSPVCKGEVPPDWSFPHFFSTFPPCFALIIIIIDTIPYFDSFSSHKLRHTILTEWRGNIGRAKYPWHDSKL
ncbi:sushi, von Willebrand factor type A, EGF and pentraxin domain-containing protein 1-like [Lineus longissimus]|uniref:sushi, von Willebrand factor type A, EGF and pentraxin domain-containing protein 1-like n=1 Tax=Lineus longissimus TaxID=88925 RepID=UPI00315C7EBE